MEKNIYNNSMNKTYFRLCYFVIYKLDDIFARTLKWLLDEDDEYEIKCVVVIVELTKSQLIILLKVSLHKFKHHIVPRCTHRCLYVSLFLSIGVSYPTDLCRRHTSHLHEIRNPRDNCKTGQNICFFFLYFSISSQSTDFFILFFFFLF